MLVLKLGLSSSNVSGCGFTARVKRLSMRIMFAQVRELFGELWFPQAPEGRQPVVHLAAVVCLPCRVEATRWTSAGHFVSGMNCDSPVHLCAARTGRSGEGGGGL